MTTHNSSLKYKSQVSKLQSNMLGSGFRPFALVKDDQSWLF